MPKKEKKVDDDLVFDYVFDGPLVDRYKQLAWNIAKTVPELSYIEEDDFDIIIAKMAPPKSGGERILAEMNYVTHWIKQYVEYVLGRPLAPYLMIIYPLLFKQSQKDKVHTMIHELFHIPPNKRRCRPHIGFGDEIIAEMYIRSRKKLGTVGKGGRRKN